mmetsp:Transcript_14415/g.24578  ORF Transcript_14415/g.24578 Transcript_14415/m.24578 type:complete len:249 (-) Transcript_14415:842-1588(-)
MLLFVLLVIVTHASIQMHKASKSKVFRAGSTTSAKLAVIEEDPIQESESNAKNLEETDVKKEERGERSRELVLRLSVQSSMKKLTGARAVGEELGVAEEADLQMLDFFKVLCLVWILTFGTAQFTMAGTAYNPWALENYFKTVAYTLVYSANLGFDEFFMISAFVSYLKIRAYLLSRQTDSVKAALSTYASIVGNRLARLAPVYYFVFLFGWLVGPYLGDGPWWYTYEKNFQGCEAHWWRVLTMSINF